MYIIVEYWTNNLHGETSEYYEFKNTDQSNSYGRIIVKKKYSKNGFRQQNEMFLMLANYLILLINVVRQGTRIWQFLIIPFDIDFIQ